MTSDDGYQLDLAYLAGVVDSDGSIYIEKTAAVGRGVSPEYRGRVVIAQVDLEAINLAIEKFNLSLEDGIISAEQKSMKRKNVPKEPIF